MFRLNKWNIIKYLFSYQTISTDGHQNICASTSTEWYNNSTGTLNANKLFIKSMNKKNLHKTTIKKCSRNWIKMSVLNNEKTNSIQHHEFAVMSYNILAQDLLVGNKHLYERNEDQYLQWHYRYEQLINEIRAVMPEILCLQEVQKNHLESIKIGLKSLNYICVYKKRTCEHYTDGCAIFVNQDIFNIIQTVKVEYNQPNISILDRHNVAVILKLELKKYPNNYLVIATTHLLYNPKRQDIRLAQIQVLLAELDRISNSSDTNEKIPIILTGDFNFQPYTAPYRLLTEGYLNYEKLITRRMVKPEPFNINSNDIHYVNYKSNDYQLPIELGITDSCQHYNVIVNNNRNETMLNQSCRNRSDNDNQLIVKKIKENDKQLSYNTGILYHNLFFTSVFQPMCIIENQPSVTTYQNQWIMVDYIFYTNLCDKNNLKLIGISKLPTEIQSNKFIQCIPNEYKGSDHFSLAAKFALMIK